MSELAFNRSDSIGSSFSEPVPESPGGHDRSAATVRSSAGRPTINPEPQTKIKPVPRRFGTATLDLEVGSPADIPDLLVITPWYPTADNAYAGTFVRESVRCLLAFFDDILVVHVENLPPSDDRPPAWSITPEGRTLWIGVPMDPDTSRADMILLQREALARHALGYLRHSPRIHCHVGAPTGAAIVPLVPPSTRLVITEHATYLSKIFHNGRARELYRAALARADVFTAVSASTARFIDDTFPGARDCVSVIPNPVPLMRLPFGPPLNPDLPRWLYVGNLTEHKGVRRVLRSFAAAIQQTPSTAARLTIVGAGPLRNELTELARALDIEDRVNFRGPVDPSEIGAIYHAHDLLVHLSHIETFGLTSVEAAACGLAVVATSSGGPEHTLALHQALHLARIVAVSDDTETAPIVEAVASLRHRIDTAYQAIARTHLERLYGFEAVGAQLNAALMGHPAPLRHTEPGMSVMAVALTDKQTRHAETTLMSFADFGGSGYFLTTRQVRANLPSSIKIIDISDRERLAFLDRAERTLMGVVPDVVISGAVRATERLGQGRPSMSAKLQSLLDRARRRQQALGTNRARSPYDLIWRNLGPALVARSLDHDGTLVRLCQDVECFILPDEFITPFAWRSLKHNPTLEVRRRWSRTMIARRYRRVVLQREPSE